MADTVINIENISKQYRLGAIGSTTLREDLQSAFARLRKKQDPNVSLNTDTAELGKKFWALNDVSFTVNQGDTLGLIGRNGSGKSTLLKILSRITSPTKGQIRYVGRVASMMEVGTGFHGELTGRENVFLNGAILGMNKQEVAAKFDEIVAFAEMEKFIDTPVKRYSSGMYVKLAFSVAAHLDAEIMVMDEILAVGDVAFQQKCLEKMSNAAHNQGRTVIYVSHNMNTIRQLCNRSVVLDKGKLIYDGNVDEGIAKYVGNAFDIKKDVDLDSIPHSRNHYTGMRMKHLEILNTDNCIFAPKDNLTFRLDFESEVDTDKAYLRGIIKYKDNTPAGQINSGHIAGIKKGMNSFVFSLPLKNIINGRYAVNLSLINDAPGVSIPYFDAVPAAFAFEVCDILSANWNHTFIGHTNLGKLLIME